MSFWHIKQASQILAAGGVISYPTESVFGLGCNPQNLEAVLQLLDLKKRPMSKGLLLVAENITQLEPYIDINDTLTINKLMATPVKPVTWIVACKFDTPSWLTGEFDSIAVRISAHPIVAQLCSQFGGAIVSTSANISGQSSARRHWMVRKYFANSIDYYVPGDVGGYARESEIRDLKTGNVIRA